MLFFQALRQLPVLHQWNTLKGAEEIQTEQKQHFLHTPGWSKMQIVIKLSVPVLVQIRRHTVRSRKMETR